MKRLFFAILVLPLLFIACNHMNEDPASEQALTSDNLAADTKKEIIPVQNIAAPLPATSDTLFNPAVPNPSMDIDKKIIKSATVKMEVKNHAAYTQKIRYSLKKYGAYIAKEENFDTDEKNESVMSIKVPVFYFDDLMNELAAPDAKQLERTITSEEVSGQIIDTKARLQTKKQTRDKYLEFMKQGKNVNDVLKVQSDINSLQEEIESAESRLAYLSSQTRYSTIDLNFFQPKEGYVSDKNPGFGHRIATAFHSGGKLFSDLVVGLLYLWPLWMLVLIITFTIKRWRQLRLLKNK